MVQLHEEAAPEIEQGKAHRCRLKALPRESVVRLIQDYVGAVTYKAPCHSQEILSIRRTSFSLR